MPAGPGSEIEAHYDDGLGMLLFESQGTHDWPFGTTFDGILTLDLDADHVLAHGEFGWVRERWPRGEATLLTPEKGCFTARLRDLSTDALKTNLRVTPMLGDDLVIEIGTARPTRRVRLGPNVDALASDSTFAGLVVTNP
jgi:hypothetical protein